MTAHWNERRRKGGQGYDGEGKRARCRRARRCRGGKERQGRRGCPRFARHADKVLILYCASGGRSALAGKVLMATGYSQVYNLGPSRTGPIVGKQSMIKPRREPGIPAGFHGILGVLP